MYIKVSPQDQDKRSFGDDEDYLRPKVHKATVYDDGSSEPLKRLRKLAGQSENVFLTIKSIYPLDFQPDTMTIDANKVNIITRQLFGALNVHSILIEDITNLTVNTGIFSATLEIVDSANLRFPITYIVKHLRIPEARLARRLIQGLISAKREGIDLTGCEGKDVMECLDILGHAKGENSEKIKKENLNKYLKRSD